MTATGRLTVQDLIGAEELGLRLVAGLGGRAREIRGVHISEMPDPTPWLGEGDVLLMTGLAVYDKPGERVRVVRRLAEKGAAALGLGVGLYFDEAPTDMRAAADRTGLPLFEVPVEVPFKGITGFVLARLKRPSLYQLRRGLTAQDHLLALLLEERGLDHLVSAAAMLLSASVLVFDGRGEVLSQADARIKLTPELREAIWELYRAAGPTTERDPGRVDEHPVVLRDVRLGGRVEQVLGLVYSDDDPPGETAQVLAEYVRKLLNLELHRYREEALVRVRMRAGLLDELISGSSRPEELEERLRNLGFRTDVPRGRLLVCDVDNFSGTVSARLGSVTEEAIQELKSEFKERVDDFFSDLRVPFVSVGKSDSVIALVQSGEEAPGQDEKLLELGQGLRQRLVEGPPRLSVTIGISNPVERADSAPAALLQAREAVRAAGGRQSPHVRLFSRLGPSVRALDTSDALKLESVARQYLDPLLRHDRERGEKLVESLRAYLDENRNVARAAEILYVHPNTLRNRLHKIEGLLGRSLEETEVLVDLALALICLRFGRKT